MRVGQVFYVLDEHRNYGYDGSRWYTVSVVGGALVSTDLIDADNPTLALWSGTSMIFAYKNQTFDNKEKALEASQVREKELNKRG